MGRRAKKAPVVTKKKVKLSKRFKCPFCANDDTVECKMDSKAGIGSLSCRLCGASYQMPIHHLHEPIDVFSEWLDDCEAAQNPNNTHRQNNDTNHIDHAIDGTFNEDDEDDELPESTGLGQQRKLGSFQSTKNNKNARSIDLGEEDSEEDDDDDDE